MTIVVTFGLAGLLGALAPQAWLLLRLRDQPTRLRRRLDARPRPTRRTRRCC